MDRIIQALERTRILKGMAPASGPSTKSRAHHIIEAVHRAKVSAPLRPEATVAEPVLAETSGSASQERRRFQISDVDVSATHLENMRIIAHDPADPRSKSFDMLRTQILQEMHANEWRVLAVTSPTAGCGKTFTAINLALSTARQPNSSVLLVDLDLQKPQIAQRLGIKSKAGVRALIEGRSALQDTIVHVAAGGVRFGIVPCERASSHSSDWISSPSLATTLQALREDRDLQMVILDLPPLLSGDDVIAVLPHVDCVLMVAAAGTTTTLELKECAQYLRSTPVVRIALNKLPAASTSYYY
jgi:protein-tyrosine kinase